MTKACLLRVIRLCNQLDGQYVCETSLFHQSKLLKKLIDNGMLCTDFSHKKVINTSHQASIWLVELLYFGGVYELIIIIFLCCE